jgi:hypothetical protein
MKRNYIFYLKCNLWENEKNIYDDNQFLTSNEESFKIMPNLSIIIKSPENNHNNLQPQPICNENKESNTNQSKYNQSKYNQLNQNNPYQIQNYMVESKYYIDPRFNPFSNLNDRNFIKNPYNYNSYQYNNNQHNNNQYNNNQYNNNQYNNNQYNNNQYNNNQYNNNNNLCNNKCKHNKRKKLKKYYIDCKIKINEIFSQYYSLNYITINTNGNILFPRKFKRGNYYFKIKQNLIQIQFSFLRNSDKVPDTDMNNFETDFPFLYLAARIKKMK